MILKMPIKSWKVGEKNTIRLSVFGPSASVEVYGTVKKVESQINTNWNKKIMNFNLYMVSGLFAIRTY